MSKIEYYFIKTILTILYPVLIAFNMFTMRRIHIKYLLLLIRFRNVDIQTHNDHNETCRIIYNHDFPQSTILMSRKLSRINFDTALLHELGHYIDFKSNSKVLKRSAKAIEKSAWKNAIKLSDTYNIPICYTTAKRWLKTYDASSAFLNKREDKDEQ